MRKINKITNIFFVCLTLILTLFTFSGCVKNIKDPTIITNNNIKNVVLIIGDGMGQNHINNAKMHFDINNLVFENDYLTTVNTSSKSIGTTDSAAAATAMATGVNVANRKIGMDGNSILENIMEIATKYGKKTGIVTTDNLTGATPAAFSSHTTDRGNSEDIVLDQVTSNINLLVGETNNLYEKYRSQFLLEISVGARLCFGIYYCARSGAFKRDESWSGFLENCYNFNDASSRCTYLVEKKWFFPASVGVGLLMEK